MTLEIDTILEESKRLTPFPSVVTEIISMIEDPHATPAHFQDIIAKDTLITAKTLKLANSAYYGFSRSISTISEAVVILGIDTLRSLIITLSAYNVLNKEIAGYKYHLEDFWKHSLATAMVTKKIAELRAYKNLETFFVAGLLHDTGKLLLDKFRVVYIEHIESFMKKNKVPETLAEKAIMGWDHCEAGAELATKWKFPDMLVDVIKFHHLPLKINNMNSPYVKYVHLADHLAYQIFNRSPPPILNHVVEQDVNLTATEKKQILEDVGTQIISFMNELKKE